MTSGKAFLLAFVFTGISIVIGTAAGGYIAYRKAKEVLDLPEGSIGSTISTIVNIEETIHNIAGDDEGEFGKRAAALRKRHAFSAREDGRLTEKQMEQFLAVKRSLNEIDEEMRADAARSGASGTGMLMKWNFFSRLQRLRMEQIDALEAQRMPLEEYNWVHGSIYMAMIAEGIKPEQARGSPAAAITQSPEEIDRELERLGISPENRGQIEQIRGAMSAGKDLFSATADKVRESVPSENRKLVASYRDDLDRYFLAAIDLDMVTLSEAMQR
ncbi:MAG TPA: hypothetical protein VMT00_17045 [Thermoanaerobaculia bacterium]|nr:hypothetical protein [Thermoanaerobaculia bacterium]